MRRALVRVAVVVAGLVAVTGLVGLAGCSDEPEAEYGEATERVFMQTCTEGDEGLSEELCRCIYERIARTIPFDEYAEIDREVRNDPDTLPDSITEIAAACAARILTPTGD